MGLELVWLGVHLQFALIIRAQECHKWPLSHQECRHLHVKQEALAVLLPSEPSAHISNLTKKHCFKCRIPLRQLTHHLWWEKKIQASNKTFERGLLDLFWVGNLLQGWEGSGTSERAATLPGLCLGDNPERRSSGHSLRNRKFSF